MVPGKISQVICLGNVNSKLTLEYLQSLSPDYQAVKGEFDSSPSLPLNKVITQGQLKIGFISGYSIIPNNDPDALLIAARQLDVDILLWGGSHKVEAYQLEGKFFINPGSATGAFYTGWLDEGEAEQKEGHTNGNENSTEKNEEPADPDPSFCLLDIQGSVCVVYIYSYNDGEVRVDKVSYRKE